MASPHFDIVASGHGQSFWTTIEGYQSRSGLPMVDPALYSRHKINELQVPFLTDQLFLLSQLKCLLHQMPASASAPP